MSGCRNGKTRGRMKPWACGHRGFGVECHRCGQANELETRANELAQIVKNQGKTFPGYVQTTAEKVVVRGGGQRVETMITGKMSTLNALSECITAMRGHATRLLKAENYV